MTDPSFVILYVDNLTNSAAFYVDILGKKPTEASPTFTMFALESGVLLGLWSRNTVVPTPIAASGDGELAFVVASKDMVNTMHTDWSNRGLIIAQVPTNMDFGYTFVALDPDGHRLRVFSPSPQ